MATPSAGPPPSLSDEAISVIRTLVPIGWGAVASWLIGLGLPAGLLATVHDGVVVAGTALLSGAWYAGWRWLEPRIPSWLVAVVLGHVGAPTYRPAAGPAVPGGLIAAPPAPPAAPLTPPTG
jgi:hypothetical protein